MLQTPASGTRTNTIFDLKRVAELEELRAGADVGLQRLPVPEVIPERAREVVEVCELGHIEEFLDAVNLLRAPVGESRVDVADHGLDVRRTVLRHVLPNGLKVAPEVAMR